MPTYSRADFDGIGAAIGKDGAEVMKYADRFESAARWYRTVHRAPERVALSVMRKKTTQIANAARKLLRHQSTGCLARISVCSPLLAWRSALSLKADALR